MLKITDEMKQAREKRIADMEQRIDKRIENAFKEGYHSTYFPCDKDTDKDIYDEIRAKYERAGYKIKPTGYIGGVWQLTEDICW